MPPIMQYVAKLILIVQTTLPQAPPAFADTSMAPALESEESAFQVLQVH